jgi:hypothetical protein
MSSRSSLSRRAARRTPKPRFLIVCEGEVTEPSYFYALRHAERSLIDLVLQPAGSPKQVVERAVELKRHAEREARGRKDPFLRYDMVWCVFDIDEHPRIQEAKQQAADNHISVAISNPCFELWVLLHFQDQTAYIDCVDVCRLCRRYLPSFEKRLAYNDLAPHLADALRRAGHLERWHAERNTNGENPSTGVYQLVAKILEHRTIS